MTLSVRGRPMLWDRTLPKPTSLLSAGSDEAFPRRDSSSWLQNHIASNNLLNGTQAGSNGTRSSTHLTSPSTFGAICSLPESEGPSVRNRIQQPNISPSSPVQPQVQRSPTQLSHPVMSTDEEVASSASSSISPTEANSGFCLCQPEPKIPRPRNAFILYRQHQHAGVVAQHPGLPNPDISKIIGEQWRALPAKTKDEWKALAEEEKTRHSQQYPDYRYKPRRNIRFNSQGSILGSISGSTDSQTKCTKCGGRIMNAPATPYTPVPHALQTMNTRVNPVQIAQVAISPPNSGRMRPYTEAFGSSQRHDLRIPCNDPQQPTSESSEAKRRRYNTDGGWARGVRSESVYYAPHGPLVGLSRLSQPSGMPPQQLQPTRTMQLPPQKRDMSLTLPPIRTSANRQIHERHTSVSQSQKSGVEAMIMSIPVLNKVKILSQISPPFDRSSPETLRPRRRGAIVAVEGLDPSSVFAMTQSLADQLERAGKFSVKVFRGPDPYDIHLNTGAKNDSARNSRSLSNLEVLTLIYDWHRMSQEMVNFITNTASAIEDSEQPVVNDKTDSTSQVPGQRLSSIPQIDISSRVIAHEVKSPDGSGDKTPPSAVSPKTISLAVDLSLRSPPACTTAQHLTQPEDKFKETYSRKSRIPPAALISLNDQNSKQGEHGQVRSPTATSEAGKDEAVDKLNEAASAKPEVTSQAIPVTTSNKSPSSAKPPEVIPVAIVPHYQLTTVDVTSIAMPITDSYSPYSHWQWLATLWRGCTGPDVTVVIKSAGEEESPDPTHPQPPRLVGQSTYPGGISVTGSQMLHRGPGVEVRLSDCRTVVVRTKFNKLSVDDTLRKPSHVPGGSSSSSNNSGGDDGGTESLKTNSSNHATGGSDGGEESWEKAKRRVGFEVEEFLRR